MSIATIKASSRRYRVDSSLANLAGFPFLEIGPAGTTHGVSTLVIQFQPSLGYDGTFTVLGRVLGKASDEVDVPFVPIPYRRVSVADVASDYAMVSDAIVSTATIQVPANGLSIALLVTSPTTGYCDIVSWDLQGSSAV